MTFPSPGELLARKKYGREEYVQDLLACLITGGFVPRWNQPVLPTARGRLLLDYLARRSGVEVTGADAHFVNEFQLLRLRDHEPSGWPDFAYLDDEAIVLIELKTEPRSHRPGQLRYYDTLASRHHTTKRRSLVYLTPPLALTAVHDDVPFTHVLLDELRSELVTVWSQADGAERVLADYTVDFLVGLDEPWTIPNVSTPPVEASGETGAQDDLRLVLIDEVGRTPPIPSALDDFITTAREVAADGQQRAIDIDWDTPTAAEDLRTILREHLNAADVPVQAWVWNQATSGGRPLTTSGQRTGTEVRLSLRRKDSPPP